MKTELNVRTFLTSLVFALILIVPYEYHFKEIEKYPRTYELESFDIWADQRAQVPNLNSEDVVILGSSRGHFDINIHVWDSLTGRRPLMLAYPGSSPFIPMEDIVNETSFNGTLIVSSFAVVGELSEEKSSLIISTNEPTPSASISKFSICMNLHCHF